MRPNEYQEKAVSTLATKSRYDTILMCALGLAGESGEVCDHLKKTLFHLANRPLNEAKIADELGDILWYIANMAYAIGFDLEDIMQANIDKLAKRHKPNGEATGFQSFYASDSGDSLKTEKATFETIVATWGDVNANGDMLTEQEAMDIYNQLHEQMQAGFIFSEKYGDTGNARILTDVRIEGDREHGKVVATFQEV